MLTIALSKGRILDDTLPLLQHAGISVAMDLLESRQLIIPTNRSAVRLIIVRASDVPTYVQHGAADLGIAGLDVLLEQECKGIYMPLDLQIAQCRLSVATRVDFDYQAHVRKGARIRVATKYVNSARQHFADKGVLVDVIKLYGSMELAPLVGLADAIVDLVSSGNTLRANQLLEVEAIRPISAHLIVNQASLKLKRDQVHSLLNLFEQAVKNN